MSSMLAVVALLEALIIGALVSRTGTGLVMENLVLRQQLATLKLKNPHPKLSASNRAFWVVLSRAWSRWADVLVIVKPATVVGWHRRGFVLFWRWKSRHVGRPPLSPELVTLIHRIARENPLWSHRRIANELAKLGYSVDKDTVAKYMPPPSCRPRRPPSQTWKTFLHNHLSGTIAVDFLVVPTVMFRNLYVFFVLSLDRRRILHVNVTAHPSGQWAAQQIVEAVGADLAPRFLIRDNGGSFGRLFDARVRNLGIEQIRITPRSPWQNGYAERWVGTLRRELLDHVIVLGERHLLRTARQYVAYYNGDRPHMGIGCDAPAGRRVEPPCEGKVVALSRVGGLHHRYSRVM